MPIRAKLLIFCIACVIVPLLTVFYFSYTATRDSQSNATLTLFKSQAVQQLAALQLSYAEAKDDLVTLSKLAVMQDVDSNDARKRIEKDLARFVSRAPEFAEIVVVNAAGTVIASTSPASYGTNLSSLREFKTPANGIEFDGRVSHSDRLDMTVAVHSMPIYDERQPDVITGALIGSIDWNYFQNLLKRQSVFGQRQGRRHQLVLQTKSENQSLYFTAGTQVPAYLLEQHFANKRFIESGDQSPTVHAYRTQTDQREALVISATSKPLMGFRDPGWRMNFVVPAEDLHRNILTLKKYYSFGGSFLLVLVLVLTYLLARSIVNPINALVRGARKLSNGHYDYSLEKTSNRDEIGKLTESFEAMRVAIRDNEDKLVHKSEVAENAARLKGEFLANMSHEVRTPINGVLGMTELLLNTELDSTQNRYTKTIFRSGQSLLSVINDILDFSKIEAGKLELQQAVFDLRDLVEDIVTVLADTAHQNNIEIVLLMPPDSHASYCGDVSRLRQVLLNLMGNAVKFSSNGDVQLHVYCRDVANDRSVLEFRVVDCGIGIEASQLGSIFDSFVQADGSTTRQFGGTGLGLAISAKLTRLMGGEIGVDSTVGEGSTFWFTAQVEKSPVTNCDVWRTPDALAGQRILIVDDNTNRCHMLESHIKFWGASLQVASTAIEALHQLEIAKRNDRVFNACIVDRHLLEKNGLELASSVREGSLGSMTRNVLLSSVGDQLDLDTCRSMGIDITITKPIRQADLYTSLSTTTTSIVDAAQDTQVSTKKIQKLSLDCTVLLAEDNPVNQDMMIELLRLMGATTVLAQNGQEALDILETRTVDLVLMDCQMPVMDGFTATREIRKREANEMGTQRMPIVALTANAMQGDMDRCLESGMDKYLSKPVSSQQLRSTLHQVLDAPEQRDDNPGSPASPSNDQFNNKESIKTTSAQPEVVHQPKDEPVATIHALASVTPGIENRTAQSTDIIDEQVFADVWSMCLQAPAGFYSKLVDKYASGSQQDLVVLEAAIAENDASLIGSRAHRLKSSSANWGGMRIAELCQSLETLSQQDDLTQAKELFEQMTNENQKLLTLLRQRVVKAA